MNAVLLAAGEGKRLRPYTYFRAKPMIKIGGRTLIERAIIHLYDNGIGRIIINIHHKPMQIIKEIRDNVLYYYEPMLMGTAGTLKCLEKWLDKTFVVMNADTFTNIDLRKMIKFHKGNKNWLTIFTKDSLTHNGGVFVFDKEVLNFIPYDYYSIHKDLIPDLIKNKIPVRCYFGTKDEYYFDCGTREKVRKARKFYEETY